MIFTGTRCTTFTKLPVAFSGGSRLNTAPVPGCRLSMCPLKDIPGRRPLLYPQVAPLHFFYLCFLELAYHPCFLLHDRKQRLAGLHVLSGSTFFGQSFLKQAHNDRSLQIEPRLIPGRLRFFDPEFLRSQPGLYSFHRGLSFSRGRRRRLPACACDACASFDLVVLGRRDGFLFEKSIVALQLLVRQVFLGEGCFKVGLCLRKRLFLGRY